MRIWSLHPKYLDSKGLVALWRESLLARNVLLGNTKGYVNHPQLERFKDIDDPIVGMDTYLYYVFLEAESRGYSFNKDKFDFVDTKLVIDVSKGQVDYEWKHLLEKLRVRDVKRYEVSKEITDVDVHPLFNVIPGSIESWERTTL